MSDDKPTRNELEQYARQVGLVNLTPEQIDEFIRAETVARDLSIMLPRNCSMTDEPAITFRTREEL
jgi:hypothetical protein